MMTNREWENLATIFSMSPQSKVQNFIRQLDADAPVALYKYFNNDTWYTYIKKLINNNLHCTISYSIIDEISQEFVEFIDGNGFQVHIIEMSSLDWATIDRITIEVKAIYEY